MPKPKIYALDASQIKPLVEGQGACFASDEIAVKGRKVGYCYREAPDNDVDSGWRFLAGDEDDAYMDDPDNIGIYDVNTIANIDPDIMDILHAPIGAHFARRNGKSPLEPVEVNDDEEE